MRFVAVLLALASQADAHALLQRAVPAVGSTVAHAPPMLMLVFSEDVEPRFCTIDVTDAHGTRVDGRALHTAPGDARRLMMDLPALAAGSYRVRWHAVSTDTHRTEGSYTFRVAP